MLLPNRIVLSKQSSNKLQMIKQKTNITPNILSRIAIMLAINSNDDISNVGVDDEKGKTLEKETLFGESIDVYEVIIRQYIHDNNIKLPVKSVITSLIEIGVHKMGHVRSLEQLCSLK